MRSGAGLRPVHRKSLLEVLAEELTPDTVLFSSKVALIKTEVLKDASSVTILHLEDGTIIRTKVLQRDLFVVKNLMAALILICSFKICLFSI